MGLVVAALAIGIVQVACFLLICVRLMFYAHRNIGLFSSFGCSVVIVAIVSPLVVKNAATKDNLMRSADPVSSQVSGACKLALSDTFG